LKISDLPVGYYYVRVASPGALFKAKEPLEIRAAPPLSAKYDEANKDIHSYPSVDKKK